MRSEEQIENYSMSIHSIEMLFESSPSFRLNLIEKFEYEKQVEEVVQVHKVCKDDDDPPCLDKLFRVDLVTHTPSLKPIDHNCEDAYKDDEL